MATPREAREAIRQAVSLALDTFDPLLITWKEEQKNAAPDGVRVVLSIVSRVDDVAKPRQCVDEDDESEDVHQAFSKMQTWKVQHQVQCSNIAENLNAADLAATLDLQLWSNAVYEYLDGTNVRHLRMKHLQNEFELRAGDMFKVGEASYRVDLYQADPTGLDTVTSIGYTPEIDGEIGEEVVIDPEEDEETEPDP